MGTLECRFLGLLIYSLGIASQFTVPGAYVPSGRSKQTLNPVVDTLDILVVTGLDDARVDVTNDTTTVGAASKGLSNVIVFHSAVRAF